MLSAYKEFFKVIAKRVYLTEEFIAKTLSLNAEI